jgi:hypothetical protein
MLKQILLSLALVASSIPVLADPTVASTPAEAAAIAADKCKTGCLILSAEDIAFLEKQVNSFAQRAFQEGAQRGYEKSVDDLAEAAKKNPKICPKQA